MFTFEPMYPWGFFLFSFLFFFFKQNAEFLPRTWDPRTPFSIRLKLTWVSVDRQLRRELVKFTTRDLGQWNVTKTGEASLNSFRDPYKHMIYTITTGEADDEEEIRPSNDESESGSVTSGSSKQTASKRLERL